MISIIQQYQYIKKILEEYANLFQRQLKNIEIYDDNNDSNFCGKYKFCLKFISLKVWTLGMIIHLYLQISHNIFLSPERTNFRKPMIFNWAEENNEKILSLREKPIQSPGELSCKECASLQLVLE
ncbi:unnamed protein product [Blepharisma stoltei]|uniref:Uncharacterized protein n=1 Tax=Blepharisma stoltei TaxID=1481888 RepID=A0AAU9IW79_9CILI|nr:unnamed protein product [Blepharisma stoltei]